MKRSGIPPPKENVDIAIAFVSRVFYDGVKLFDFRHQFGIIFGHVTAKFAQDLYGFRAAMVGDKPPARQCQNEDYVKFSEVKTLT